MRFQQEIDSFLQGKSALDLIQCFDTEFDIPFKHDQCIGLLEMLGTYELTDRGDDLKLAEHVGAWWCRVVRADVSYNILDGLESIQSSASNAQELYQRVLHLNKETQTMAYIAARWHDGAAKIHYRCNDHTEARLLFQKAKELAERTNLWYCLPDIESNRLRVEYEELKTVEIKVNLITQYKELLNRTLKIAEQHQILILGIDRSNYTLKRNLLKNEREFLRGLASTYHNLSLELEKTSSDSSKRASKNSEKICRMLGDKYRLAQALNHQGKLAQDKKDFQGARQRFEEVDHLPWRRGQLIARQNLAQINAQEGAYEVALQQITHLLDQVQESNQRRGGDLGFDSDFYYFTVKAFKSILEAIKANPGNEPAQAHQARLSEEWLQMVRSIRKVVKITTYKTAFSKRFYPIYLELIADCIQRLPDNTSALERSNLEHHEKAFTLLEEASSRELLDLLQARTLPSNVDDIPAIPLSHLVEEEVTEPQRGRRGSIRFGGSQANTLEVLSLLDQRRLLYETSSLNQPIATSEPNLDIAYEVRMFTANHPGLVIVRYFFYVTLQQRNLGAYVFRDGIFSFRWLDWPKIQDRLIKPWERTWGSSEGRTPGDGRHLSELLIEPLWPLITAGGNLDEHCHLILIPSGELFKLPLHVAFVPRTTIPLAAYVPLSFSVSATAYVTRGRHLLRCQRVEKDDDLCALVKRDKQVSGREIVELTWPESSFHIAGQPPEGVGAHQHHGPGLFHSK